MADSVGLHPADNAFLPVVIGTVVWAVAGVTTWFLRDAIGVRWTITCAIAVVCGLGGVAYLRWRAARLRRRAQSSSG